MDGVIDSGDRLEMTGRVRNALTGLMDIESYSWDDRGGLTLRGHVVGAAQAHYRAIRAQIETLGYTPFLRRHGTQDELFAAPGVLTRKPQRIVLPAVLFCATVLTVLLTGTLNADAAIQRSPVLLLQNPLRLLSGLPFAATLLAILFAHEMGHFIIGRLRGAPVSLPYFIPIPPIPTPIGVLTFTGTLGAVIVQREPMEDRRTVLEVGIAGPLAGLLAAIPLLLYGLATSPVATPTAEMLAQGYIQEGNSILYGLAKLAVFGHWLPANGLDVQINPIAFAAWIGLLVTMLNMLPVGQLDGGHIAYALLGRKADWLAYAMLALCLIFGVTKSLNWLVWAAMIGLIGLRHPEPLNDIEPLGWGHKALAVFGLILFILLFMPEPIRSIAAS